jgi:hypothetical protein
MTDTLTSQNIDLSSWDTLYILIELGTGVVLELYAVVFSFVFFIC